MYKTKIITISNNIRLRQKEVSLATYQFADTLAEIIIDKKELFNSIKIEPRIHNETEAYMNFKRVNRI